MTTARGIVSVQMFGSVEEAKQWLKEAHLCYQNRMRKKLR